MAAPLPPSRLNGKATKKKFFCDFPYLVSLDGDAVPVEVDGAEPRVDLQGLRQQPGPHVPHPVTSNVQDLVEFLFLVGLVRRKKSQHV